MALVGKLQSRREQGISAWVTPALREMWFMETPSFSTGVVGGRQTPALLENVLRNLSKWFLGLSVGFFYLKVQFNT